MDFKVTLLLFLCLLKIITCSKYAESANLSEQERPFRMAKVNMLWEKAKKVLKGPVLSDLYADLVVQDKKERDLKQVRVDNSDPDGLKEAAVRQSFVDIITQYHLEKQFSLEDYEIRKSKRPGQPEIKDDNLKKLWKKAMMEGFAEDELSKLKEEFGHQQLKIDEYESLKVEYDELHGRVDNSLENLDDQEELWKSLSMKKHTLKDRHAKLREKLQKLEMKVTNPESGKERQFKDSRVYHLWALAQKTNMTEEELESLKKELTHFEHRITKHDILQSQVQKSEASLREGNRDDHTRHEELKDRVEKYGRKVAKYHEDLKQKINKALQHTEL